MNCYNCNKELPKPPTTGGTGYALTDKGKLCYDCCGERDRETLRNMAVGDKRVMYFSTNKEGRWVVSNWCGTLSLYPTAWGKIGHNMAYTAYQVWFTFEGKRFYGRNIGDNQLLRFKRIKD